MKLLIRFITSLLCISAINSTAYTNLKQFVLPLGDQKGNHDEPNNRDIEKALEPLKGLHIGNNDVQAYQAFREPKEILVKFVKKGSKNVNDRNSYKGASFGMEKISLKKPLKKPRGKHRNVENMGFRLPLKKYLMNRNKKHEDIPRKPLKDLIREHSEEIEHRGSDLDEVAAEKYKEGLLQYLKNPSKAYHSEQPHDVVIELKPYYRNDNDEDPNRNNQDVRKAKDKARAILKARELEQQRDDIELASRVADLDRGQTRFKKDSILNGVKKVERRAAEKKAARKRDSDDSSGTPTSSSNEVRDWKDEFKQAHIKKKYEALKHGRPRGDVVNMVAARPYGVACGDPNQHDLPWGSCMLNMECEPEFRIFRGDHFCGRTEYVCCAILVNNYDMYQGIDVSLDSKSLSTDSGEKKSPGKPSRDNKKRKGNKAKKRRKERAKRKNKIKKNIKNIVKEIKKLLDKQYKNGTKQRKKKTSLLKKFVKKLKKQYKKDRMALQDIHAEALVVIDAGLMNKLNQLQEVNHNFLKNDTFRQIVINGTITKTGARMLVEAYPDLEPYLLRVLRRAGDVDNFGDYLEYDLEYGYLYY